MARLKISADSCEPVGTRIQLDGQDLVDVTGLVFTLAMDNVLTAKITHLVSPEIDVECEVEHVDLCALCGTDLSAKRQSQGGHVADYGGDSPGSQPR